MRRSFVTLCIPFLTASLGCSDDTQKADAAANDAAAVKDGSGIESGAVDAAPASDGTPITDAGTSIPGPSSIGSPCKNESDCKGGFCLDLPAADPKCKTKVCTVVCPSWVVDDKKFCASMSSTSEAGDCSDLGGTIKGKTVCTFKSWATQHCP